MFTKTDPKTLFSENIWLFCWISVRVLRCVQCKLAPGWEKSCHPVPVSVPVKVRVKYIKTRYTLSTQKTLF